MLSPKEFQELYMSVYEGKMDAEDRKEMRRLAAQERAAGKTDRMDSKAASKYASSEAQSADREDKKSKGKHIHGMADSYEMEGDIVEKKDDSYLETDMKKRMKNNEKAIEDMKKTKAHADMVKAARKHFEEVDLEERKLDPTETREKERIVKGLKKSAADFKQRYGARAKSVMYATATKMAKDHMDTSKSDRRYSAER
jgi:Na+/phosphate symporter